MQKLYMNMANMLVAVFYNTNYLIFIGMISVGVTHPGFEGFFHSFVMLQLVRVSSMFQRQCEVSRFTFKNKHVFHFDGKVMKSNESFVKTV